MEEKYLCITCKWHIEFFDLYCFPKDDICPSDCTECEYYEEEEY